MLQRNRHAEYRKSVREVRRAIERIDIPAILATLIGEPLLFAQHVVCRPLLPDAFPDQHLGRAIRRRHQVGISLVFDLQVLMKVMHQQSARLASNGRHGWEKAVVGVRHRSGYRASGFGYQASSSKIKRGTIEWPKHESRSPKPASLPLPAVFRDI